SIVTRLGGHVPGVVELREALDGAQIPLLVEQQLHRELLREERQPPPLLRLRASADGGQGGAGAHDTTPRAGTRRGGDRRAASSGPSMARGLRCSMRPTTTCSHARQATDNANRNAQELVHSPVLRNKYPNRMGHTNPPSPPITPTR